MTEWDIQIRESLARKIALQITQGLAYLHSEGICHGNLTSSDVLFQLADFDAWSQEKVYEQLGVPNVLDLDTWSREPSFPRYLVDSAQFFRASPGLLTENIRIIDYGDSFPFGWPNTDQGTRMSRFNDPENLRGPKVTRSSDLWALGCIIYEIRAGHYLFFNLPPEDALCKIRSLPCSHHSDLLGPKFDNDGYPDPNEKRKITEESTKERISQFVVEIEVEPRANSEGAIIETRGLGEARNVGSKPLLEAPVIECDPVLILCFGNGPKFAPKQKSGKWRNLHQRSRPRKQAIF